MPAQDMLQIKDKMVMVLKNRGPSLPVHIAKEVGLSIAFNGTKELQKVSTYSINQENKEFRAILEYF